VNRCDERLAVEPARLLRAHVLDLRGRRLRANVVARR
jgi:hypothetical protein